MQVGTTATVYHTVINAGLDNAVGVTLSMAAPPPGVFAYQQTDCTTNVLVGALNPTLDIPAGGLICYALFFTPSAPFPATAVHIQAQASNAPVSTLLPGINTWLLRATNSPGPDIIALTNSTAGQTLTSCSMLYAFSISLMNVGAAASQITVLADTGSVSLPVSLTVYQINPTSGAIIGNNILTNVQPGDTAALGVYVLFGGCIPFDPATHRIYVRFLDDSGNVVGSTSTAVSSKPCSAC